MVLDVPSGRNEAPSFPGREAQGRFEPALQGDVARWTVAGHRWV
jgi:hypothetical protein